MGERRGTKALELWCRRMTEGYQGVRVDNMTTSWRDGLAFCAMIHHFRPDLIEFEKLNKADVYYNNELAFTTAEKYLGIPALLDADDMAAYAVPDRLSILTYLSQFYQVFAAQDSPNRLKRPPPTAEKSPLTKTAGPPAKMAHVVGVPRRDPCLKCQLPVFLAERLTVGKKVYHRTCLKCARCNSQLTPGNFYETEVDNEYCCETCPDEEMLMTSSNEMAASGDGGVVHLRDEASGGSDRTSIADRLAFFEQAKMSGGVGGTSADSDNRLLQKNISDEEKSASLKRSEDGYAGSSNAIPYRGNAALSNFLSNTLDDDKENDNDDNANNSDTEDDEEQTEPTSSSESHTVPSAPALPSTMPPRMSSPSPIRDDAPMTTTDNGRRFTATAQLHLSSNISPERKKEAVKKSEILMTISNNETDGIGKATIVNEIVKENKEEKIMESQMDDIIKSDSENTRIIQSEEDKRNNKVAEGKIRKKDDDDDGDDDDDKNVDDDDEVILSAININKNCSTKDKIAVTQIEIDELSTTKQAQTSTSTLTPTTAIESNQNMTIELITQSPKEQPMEIISSANDEKVEDKHEQENHNSDKIETSNVSKSPVELRTKSPRPQPTREDRETTERLSVVRARLQQFEVIAQPHAVSPTHGLNNNNNNQKQEIHTDNRIGKPTHESHEVHELHKNDDDDDDVGDDIPKVAVVVEHEKIPSPIEIELNKSENENADKDIVHKITEMEVDMEEEMILIAENEAEEEVNVVEHKEDKDKSTTESLNQVPSQIEMVVVPSINEQENVQIPVENAKNELDRREVSAAAVIISQEKEKPREEVIKTDHSKTSEMISKQITIAEYPEDLNPFASDDEDNGVAGNNNNNNTINNSNNVVQLRHNKENISPQKRPQTLGNTTMNGRTVSNGVTRSMKVKSVLNPFDSSDDEIELNKTPSSSNASIPTTPSSTGKIPPPRPPPPRISRNPFGDVEEDDIQEMDFSRRSSVTSSLTKKTPVPTPRTNVSLSGTPEPTPRLSTRTSPSQQQPSLPSLQNSKSEYYGSANSLGSSGAASLGVMQRNSDMRGSNNSLSSSAGGTMRSRKNRKAPAPPMQTASIRELFPATVTMKLGGDDNNIAVPTTTTNSSMTSTPNSSTVVTPKMGRKKRPAPAPPKPARLETAGITITTTTAAVPKNLHDYPLQGADLDSHLLSDEEKVLLEGKTATTPFLNVSILPSFISGDNSASASKRNSLRLIPLDVSLMDDLTDQAAATTSSSDDVKRQQMEDTNVVYRRSIMPPSLDTPPRETNPLLSDLVTHDRQLEKLKDNKEAQNRNRQSQISAGSSGGGTGALVTMTSGDNGEEIDHLSAFYNKSAHGKWKRRKGPAPALPVPPRKILQMLPLQEIRHELDIIEVQQQGLEKQGVILEKMIRDRCEGADGQPISPLRSPLEAVVSGDMPSSSTIDGNVEDDKVTVAVGDKTAESVPNSKEVEDLILQLFELVNEKNELFRRQAELMYLRRQHRLEQEQADLEYEIRVLMAQPERNKTDTDKSREEALIARLVEVVQLRNEVVECLEMDRLREAEEDLSIKQRLELHTAKREDVGGEEASKSKANTSKLSKKEKKKQKEAKKVSKSKKIDADKDADETELSDDKQRSKLKKLKKKFLF